MIVSHNNMQSRIISFVGILFVTFFLSGCFSSSDDKENTDTKKPSYAIVDLNGGMIRSVDGGQTYEPFIMTSGGANIRSVNIYSMKFSHRLGTMLYFGSEKDGLFRRDELKTAWENVPFPPQKVYGLEVFEGQSLSDTVVYATGVLDGRAKIYKSIDSAKEWKEIYTEPQGDSVILSLAIHPKKPSVVYAGTSNGVVIQSEDSGITWKNIHTFDSPVLQLEFDHARMETLYVLLFENEVEVSNDGGKTFFPRDNNRDNPLMKDKKISLRSERAYSLAVDPNRPGVVYAGTGDGLFRSSDSGISWDKIDIIESVSKTPIRSVAVNPFNSEEIIFGAGSVLYKSSNGGKSWYTFQLDTKATPVSIQFDPANQDAIYVGFRTF